MTHDQRHGSPYDRGGADYYYGRAPDPHYYPAGVAFGFSRDRITDLTDAEIKAYGDGFDDAEKAGIEKDWD